MKKSVFSVFAFSLVLLAAGIVLAQALSFDGKFEGNIFIIDMEQTGDTATAAIQIKAVPEESLQANKCKLEGIVKGQQMTFSVTCDNPVDAKDKSSNKGTGDLKVYEDEDVGGIWIFGKMDMGKKNPRSISIDCTRLSD